jgi:uncharacterized membrane protein YeaQ/YmgE (transglycosylase-associated protein family)
MAPFFYFLFIGIGLGLLTALIRREDGFGFFSDVELGLLGSLISGMAYIFWTKDLSLTAGSFAVPAVSAMLMILGLGHFTGNKRDVFR